MSTAKSMDQQIAEARVKLREMMDMRNTANFEQIKEGCEKMEDDTIPRIPRSTFVSLYLPVFCNLPHLPEVVEFLKSRNAPVPTMSNWLSYTGRINSFAWVVDDNDDTRGLIKIPPILKETFAEMFSNIQWGDNRIDLSKTIKAAQVRFEADNRVDPRTAAKAFQQNMDEISIVAVVGFQNLEFKPSPELIALYEYFRPEILQLAKAFVEANPEAAKAAVVAPASASAGIENYLLDE